MLYKHLEIINEILKNLWVLLSNECFSHSISMYIKLYGRISYQISCFQCLDVYMNFLECTNVDSLLPLKSYPLTCNLDHTCTKVSCCVDSPVVNSTFEVLMEVDPCNRMLYLEIENLKTQIPFKDIKWGKANIVIHF